MSEVVPANPGALAGRLPAGAETGAPSDRGPVPGPVLPGWAAALLAVAGGGVLDLSFPDPGWWPLAPVAVAALALACRGRRAVVGAGLGLLHGLACFLPLLSWSGAVVGHLPWVALAVLESLFPALLGALLPAAWRVTRPGRGAGTVLAVSGLWATQEALRSRIPFGGFPWARLAFSQADSPALGLAALGGAPLVGAAVAAAGALLAVGAVAVSRAQAPGPRRLGRRVGTAVVALVLAAAVIGSGALVPRPVTADRSARVAAVQGNVPRAGLEFNAERRAVLDNHVRGTLALAEDVRAGRVPRPEVVLWPENSSDIDPLRNPDAAAAISAAAAAVDVPVLVGAVLDEPTGYVSNAGLLWGPEGSLQPGPAARYVKRHPAPFAEYIPFRSFFRRFSSAVDLVQRDFAAGTEVGVLPVAGGIRLGDVICFEVAYDSLVRDPVQAGANLLVVQTNNATFGLTDESVQQLAMSRLRAVETGRSVVHISTVGVSALIAPDGSFVQRSGHFVSQTLQGSLPLREGETVAMRLGAAPEWLAVAVGLILVAGTRRRPAGARVGSGGRAAGGAGLERLSATESEEQR